MFIAVVNKKTTKKPTKKRSSARGRGTKAQIRQENREVAGLILLSVGFVLCVALYTSATGVFGSFIADFLGRFVGLARYIVPPIALFAGWNILRNRNVRKKKRRRFYPSEILAWACLAIGFFSLLDILGGRPFWSSPVDALSGGGGWLGVYLGGTLSRYLGDWGQVIITFTLFAVAATLLTSVSVGEYADAVAERLAPLKDRVNEWFSNSGWADRDEKPESRRRRYKKVFEDEDDLDPGDDYIDLRKPDALEEVEKSNSEKGVSSGWETEAPTPLIEVPGVSVAAEDSSMYSMLPEDGTWHLPNLSVLDRTEVQDVDRASVEATGRKLEHALAEHNVETRLIGVVVGPTVSRFELELGPGVKVQKVTSLHKDIAYAMATPDVRILAPIPGKQAIGVEVPNVRRQIVTVGDLLVSEEASAATHPLEVALGRDINGRTVMANLAEMPHLLVAGQTGSGKSSCINSMLTSILMRSTPDQVRLILVDPKRVELTQYKRLPHLLTDVVVDPKKAANALSWAVREMERRYDLLSELGVRDLTGYNNEVEEEDKLSFILIVLDELADLMMVAARDVEESICRIAQKARAVGIHLVIATQRPSINIITGLIKANVPARLAFAVSSLTDSRVILDQPGAERLVGRGDALLNDGRSSTPVRYQGAWVTEEEVSDVVEHWVAQSPEHIYDTRVIGEEATGSAGPGGIPGGTTGDESDDELILTAIDLVVKSQLGSTSMLQRKLRIGFARAGRMMDLLEERGIVGPSVGSKAREVLMTKDDLEAGRWPAQAKVQVPVAQTPVQSAPVKSVQPVIEEKKPRRRTLADIPNPGAYSSAPKPERKTPVEYRDPVELIEDDDELEFVDGLDDTPPQSSQLHVVKKEITVDEPINLGDNFSKIDEDDLLFDDDLDDDPAMAPPPGYNQLD